MLWGVAAGARKKAFLTAEMGQRGGGGGDYTDRRCTEVLWQSSVLVVCSCCMALTTENQMHHTLAINIFWQHNNLQYS